MLSLAGVPSMIQLIGMFFMPESPRWLGKAGRSEEQRKVIKLIYKEEHVEAVNNNLIEEVASLEQFKNLTETQKIKSLCTTYGRCILIGCSM